MPTNKADDRIPVRLRDALDGGLGLALRIANYFRIMLEGDPGEYSYTIPGSDIGFTGLLVQIKAVDGANNDTLTVPLSVPVSYPAETLDSGTLPGMFTSTNGIPDSTWRLFSAPGFLTNSSLSLNIGDELGVESGDFTWKVFAFNSNTGSYAAPSNLLAGVGYWINQRLKSGLNFKLTAGQSKDLDGFEIDMEPETWYLIGNPFPFDLSSTFDGRFFGPITYDGSGWSAEQGTMEPWGGYAVYNRSLDAETLILSAVPGPLLLAKATEPEQLDGWLMHLAVKGEYYTDIANSIGRIKGASEQLDRFDAPEPPFIDGYITLVMERPEWGGNLTALSSDIRSWEETDGTWDLQLRTKNSTGPIALTTQLEGDLPAGNKVVLMDLQQRAVYDLTAGEVPAAITGYSERYPYYLKVMAGSAEYVDQAVDEVLAQLPVDFALAQNYPNPFNPTTRLQYSLIRPAPVSLKIYNLLGQEITTLYEGWQDLGRFEVVWDGRDRYGNGVATGIYFAVFRAQGRMYTRKMLLLK
ncbi:MAG: T9SS type A sorting domain-containing protein [Candidatus Marinimicrobia bacterium]|nr:T9SS type A sorting domain-containing protein [Candidatus Neomarinimicrobiota bacterium]